MRGAGRFLAPVARPAARFTAAGRSLLAKPFPAWASLLSLAVVGAIAVSSASGGEHIIREVRVVERLPGSDRVVVKTVYVCAGDVKATTLNEVRDADAESGEAGTKNHASAHGNTAITQNAEAKSGDILLGVKLDIDASCSTVTANIDNRVSDVKAETGDSEAENRAAVGDHPSPSPSPEVLSEIVASPTPLETASATPVIESSL